MASTEVLSIVGLLEVFVASPAQLTISKSVPEDSLERCSPPVLTKREE